MTNDTSNNNGVLAPIPAPSDLVVKGDDGVEIPVAMAEASAPKEQHQSTLVAASETVPPQVKWEPEHRVYHDKVWGLLYVCAFLAFVASGSFLVSNAHSRYEFVTLDNSTYGFNDTVRIVSSHFRGDAEECCANTVNDGSYRSDLCSELDAATALSYRMSFLTLRWDDDDTSSSGDADKLSKYKQGDGMFDAFLEAPEIIITMSLLALFLALMWVVLLRFFAVPIVYATEAVKVAFFLYLSITAFVEGIVNAGVVSLGCALALVAWDIYTFKKLQFAGQMLEQAARSFKENGAMFFAFLPILILYAGNAGLFVLFFARSFEVVEVQAVGNSCEYVSPSYTYPIVLYLSLAYLWSILLFNTMRLSIIANVIGSWHFHPEHQPGIVRAIINTCTTSMGTLSVASLISTVAERLNRMFLKENMLMNCWNPAFWVIMPLYCLFGTCLRSLIQMLTKFSVVLHCFTGKTWMGSAKKVYKILKRHFKGGFVTEYASSSVLSLGSYVFSIGIYFLAWVWLDREFNTDTFVGVNDDVLMAVGWLFFALFNIWFPVLGLYLLIVLNRWLSKSDLEPEFWITPMAATFIGLLSMMFFQYLAGIFLDTTDTMFLCFAIDSDNQVDLSNDEFAKLVYEGVPTVLTEPDLEGTEEGNDEEAAEVNM